MCINIDVRVPGAGPDLDTPPCIIQTVPGTAAVTILSALGCLYFYINIIGEYTTFGNGAYQAAPTPTGNTISILILAD